VLPLQERLRLLESDLLARPPRIAVYRELPFAIVPYEPSDEWRLRREVSLLKGRLEAAARSVRWVSLADCLWAAIDRCEGLEALVALERQRGFAAAQAQVTTYLSDPDWAPLSELVLEHLDRLDPQRDVAFLVHAAAMAPAIYPMSRLLDELQGRTEVPAVLFYPGSLEGATGLRFMDLPGREPMGNYRVKIYG
jgi:hypothetical protein